MIFLRLRNHTLSEGNYSATKQSNMPMKQKNANNKNMHKHNIINSTEVLVTWKDKLASHPSQVPVALMLSIYCREKLNGGILENAREFLNNENQRNQLGLKIGDSEMLLHEQSPFWHWEQDSLHVDFYDLHSEKRHLRKQKMAKRSAVAALRNKRYSEKNRNQNLVK